MLVEVFGWLSILFLITILYRIFRYLFLKKKINTNDILLISKDIKHSGPFSGSFKYKKWANY